MGALLRVEAEDSPYLPYIEFRLSFLEHRVGEFEVVNEGQQEIKRAYLGNGDHLMDGGLAPSMVLGYSLGQNWLAEILHSAGSGYVLEIEGLESEDFESHAKFKHLE